MTADLFRLDGRSALVTGGGSGIGQRLAAGLAEYGADVSIVDLPVQSEGSATTVARIGEVGRRAVSIPADVTDPESVENAVAAHEAEFGGIDVAVNCAGVNHGSAAEDLDPEQWRRVLGGRVPRPDPDGTAGDTRRPRRTDGLPRE